MFSLSHRQIHAISVTVFWTEKERKKGKFMPYVSAEDQKHRPFSSQETLSNTEQADLWHVMNYGYGNNFNFSILKWIPNIELKSRTFTRVIEIIMLKSPIINYVMFVKFYFLFVPWYSVFLKCDVMIKVQQLMEHKAISLLHKKWMPKGPVCNLTSTNKCLVFEIFKFRSSTVILYHHSLIQICNICIFLDVRQSELSSFKKLREIEESYLLKYHAV